MKASVPRLLATASDVIFPTSIPLLAPIPLYRRLLRAHRNFLTPEMRVLGDKYIQSEFRAHRHVDNPLHVVGYSFTRPFSFG